MVFLDLTTEDGFLQKVFKLKSNYSFLTILTEELSELINPIYTWAELVKYGRLVAIGDQFFLTGD